MKARERQLLKDVGSLKEARSSLEEDLLKMRNNNAVLDLQVKELQGELEVEQNFATLYKTQVCVWALGFVFRCDCISKKSVCPSGPPYSQNSRLLASGTQTFLF